jgi:hypothetical protein
MWEGVERIANKLLEAVLAHDEHDRTVTLQVSRGRTMRLILEALLSLWGGG